MKPTVKYLINGKYHHATVKDVGDIEKLKTKIKTDLVSAINELVTEGTGSDPGIGAEVEEKLAEINKTLNELKSQVDGGLNETQIKDLESILDGALDVNYEKISKEIDERANQTKLEIKEDTDRINQEVDGVKRELVSTEKKLEETKADLSKVELNVNEVNVKYDEVTGELEKTVKSTEFDLLESKVTQNERVLTETAEEVKSTIKRDEWDVAQGKVTALENTVTETAEGLSRTVSKEQMREEINAIDTHNPNLLYTTLDWSGWFDINGNGAKILNETYQHCNILELGGDANKGMHFDDLIHGETYTVSIWARQENIVDGTLKFVMVKTGYPDIEVEMTQANGDKYVQGEMRRFMGTFVAPSHPVALHFNSNEIVPAVSKLLLAGSKIELGLNATGYTVHVKDSYKSIEKLSTKVDQTADGLRINTNQLKATDLKVTKTENEIVILSDKQIQTMKKVEEVGDIATESKNVSERTAEEMKNKISKTDATEIINGLDVESRNLQPNGNFFDDFDKWTQSSEWSIKEKVGKKFAWITRNGIAKELDLALFGQYTGVKEGSKITFGFDMFVENLSQYDTRKPIRIELYDIKNQRVDFKDFTLEELGVNIKEGLNERIKGSYDVSRKDVEKVRLRFALQKNGAFGVTDVSLRTGAISDYSWGPAPEDNAKVTAKLETSISQKADVVEITAVKKDIEKITKDVTETSAQWKLEANKISQEVEKVEKNKASKTELQQTETGFNQKVTEVEKKVGDLNYVSTNLWAPLYYATNKGYITSSGAIVDDPNLIYSDYIAVGDNTSLIRTTLEVPRLAHTSVSYYDTDKKFIRIIQEGATVLGSRIYNFPSKTAYVRFNFVNPKTHGGKHKVEFGDKATDWSVSPLDVGVMSTRVSEIKQESDIIKLEVGEVSKEGKRNSAAIGVMSTRVSEIKQESDLIKLEVAEVKKEGSSNSAAIGVMSNQIQLKVNKDGVIGSINATAEKAVISFSKIEMNGKVTFNHLDKESQGKINNATTQANIASNQIDSWKRPGTTLIDGGNIYADSLNVKSLSAIAGNLGNITAGSLKGKELAINLNDGWIEAKSSYLDHKGTPWDGSVSISKGRVHASSSNLVESVNSSISSSGLSVTGLFKSNPNGDFGITGVSSYTYNEMTIRTRLGQNIARVASETSADGSRYGVIELSDNTAVSPDNYDVRISGQKEIINLEANNVIFGKVGGSQSVLVRNQWKAHSSAKNMYVIVAKGGVLKITETEYNGASAPIEASKFFATGNIFYGGNNTQLLSENGYLLLRSTRSNIYLQAETTVNCTKPSAPGTPIDIFAKNFKPGSMAEYKTNIEVFNKSGLKIVDNTDIYEYNFKTDAQDGISKKSIGIVIGEGYRTPSEITDEKSVDLYGMTTVAWKAIQELSEKVKRLENILRKEEQNEK